MHYRISRCLVSPNVQIFRPVDTVIQEKMDEGQTNFLCAKTNFSCAPKRISLVRQNEFHSSLLYVTHSCCTFLTCHCLLVLMPHLVGQHLRLMRTNREKIEILDKIEERQKNGESLREICRSLEIQPIQARKWRASRAELSCQAKAQHCSVHSGRPSFLKPLEDDLMAWFLQMREQGVMVSTRLVVVKASQLSAQFRRKTSRAKDQIVRRFLASNKITIQSVTHTCQRPPDAVVDEAMSFILHVREKVVGLNRQQKYILNMDQTPVFFDMPTGKTLNHVGKLCRNFVSPFTLCLSLTTLVQELGPLTVEPQPRRPSEQQ